MSTKCINIKGKSYLIDLDSKVEFKGEPFLVAEKLVTEEWELIQIDNCNDIDIKNQFYILNMKKQIEIERKFLMARFFSLDRFSLEELAQMKFYDIQQWYSGDTRYRKTTHNDETTYEVITKVWKSLGTSEEIIEASSEEEFLQNTENVIDKARIKIPYKGLVFEIDIFKNFLMCICEVELESLYQPIEFPDFIKELILMEVTDNRNFSNKHLATLC